MNKQLPITVLLVDDSQITLSIIEKTIRIAGFPIKAIFHASNGHEAYDIIKTRKIDLVISDIIMPVMTGVELVNKLKANGYTKKLRIIVISSEGSKTKIEELKANGISGFLRKPFKPEDVKELINRVMWGQDERKL